MKSQQPQKHSNRNDMSKQTILALADLDGQMCYFDQDSLLEQLASANIPGTGQIKGAFRNLANRVAEMRRVQGQYFAAAYGSPEKAAMLKRSKELEKQVDDIIKNFNPVLERL